MRRLLPAAAARAVGRRAGSGSRLGRRFAIAARSSRSWRSRPTRSTTPSTTFWGRQILHGHLPSFAVFDGPTEHPLGGRLRHGARRSSANTALRLVVLGAVISFVLVAAGTYRLTRTAFTPAVGVVAVLLLLTRFNFEFLAARGYVDVTYSPRSSGRRRSRSSARAAARSVFLLLVIAELIRPDAWLLAGLYWLWCVPEGELAAADRLGGDHRRRADRLGRARLDRDRPAAASRCTARRTPPSRSGARCRSSQRPRRDRRTT